jgi:3-oxoacyl-[acyl-carrier-protein] synthase-3
MTSDITRPNESADLVKRSRTGRLMGVQVVGVGGYVPDNIVKNDDLVALGYDAEWIRQRTGILERRHAPPGIATSDMAVEAAQQCIKQAGVNPQDIDLVLVGTFSPDLLLPSTACLVQDRLGLRAPALDLQAACSSFAFSLLTGMQYIATGCSRLVLVVGAECNSRILDPADKRTYPLFGDGAGAVLLAPGSAEQGMLSFAIGADGSGASLLWREMGGSRMPFSQNHLSDGLHYMRMEGRPIFKWAVRMLQDTIGEVLRQAGLTENDINLIVLHQANIRIIDAAVQAAGLDPKKVVVNLSRFGNTSSASIPLALNEAFHAGRIQRGDVILLSGFGAGLTWATGLLRW